ncbi:unnamed protein product [Symbiodinium sp. CCMP2456]|nr:unnamed protein product [Symbiodinium sp. CCMP2456]
MSLGEYEFNCLDDALNSWHCVSMPESMFRKTVLGKAAADPAAALEAKQKAALRRLDRVTGSYEYTVTVRKSQFVPPKSHRRHAGPISPQAVQLEKLVVDVVPEMEGYRLRVEYVGDGLVAAWNRANPCFAVRPGDYIVKVDAWPACSFLGWPRRGLMMMMMIIIIIIIPIMVGFLMPLQPWQH